MAEMVKQEPFASVYVLDAHFQYKDVGVVNVFNSPAGRAVMSTSPSPKKNTRTPAGQWTQNCLSRRSNNDKNRFVLSPETLVTADAQNLTRLPQINHDIYLRNEPPRPNELDTLSVIVESRNIFTNGNADTLTDNLESVTIGDDFRDADLNKNRRIVSRRNLDNRTVNNRDQFAALDRSRSLSEEDRKLDGGGPERMCRYSSDKNVLQYDAGFNDEKCDILRRLLSGFLSGWSGGSGIIRWRKRKSSEELYREASLALGIPCELTDSCRCIECQCHYFDCGDSESESSDISISLLDCEGEDWSCDQTSTHKSISSDIIYFEENESSPTTEPAREVAGAVPQAEGPPERPPGEEEVVGDEGKEGLPLSGAPPSGAAAPPPAGDDVAPSLEMAAGTPVILDHLLNNPMTCSLQ